MLDHKSPVGQGNDSTKADGQSTGPELTKPPAISLPKGGGAIRGIGEKFAANPVTGTQCDGVKGKNQLISCLAPDRRVEVRVTGVQEVQQ